jgi:ubiquinone/menaquinone biosynthesis C-methylase UbiE
MSVTSRIRFRVCVIVWSAFVGGVFLTQHADVYAAAQGAASEQLAAQIYKAAGIRGGLVVHVGCGDGRLTAQLRVSDRFLVHGLDVETQNVDAAREHIRSLGLYGQVSIDRFVDGRLPYVDNSVNLLVAQQPGAAGMDEVLRVLCPGGVALTLDPETRTLKPETIVHKPWPDEIDEWTHYLHGPNGNAIADDSVVGPP